MEPLQNMSESMMMSQMQKHFTFFYTFDVLVVVGLITISVFLYFILKELRNLSK